MTDQPEFVELGREDAVGIATVFRDAFAASEGEAEGALIGGLAHRLLTETPPADLQAFAVRVEDVLAGAVIFTRMVHAGDARQVMLLSPLAVVPDRQGRGLGEALVRHGLGALRARGVDVALTYGDPAWYGRVGFRPIGTDVAAAPYPLSQPQGWLGQSLTGADLSPLAGPSTCAAALADPALW